MQTKHYPQKNKTIPKKMNKPRSFKCFICEGPNKTKSCPKNPKLRQNAVKDTSFAMTTTRNQGEWILESGTSDHMTNRKEWLTDFKKLGKPLRASTNGERMFGEAVGNILNDNGSILVRSVIYLSRLSTNY